MSTIKHILVPVNGTQESLKALDIAGKFATLYNAQINLLLVTYFTEETDSTNYKNSWLPAPLTTSVSKYAQSIFSKAISLLPKNVSIVTHHFSGQPKEQILEFTKKHETDVIIMGCRNLSFFSTILNGSVSRHILEKSACSVIIVK